MAREAGLGQPLLGSNDHEYQGGYGKLECINVVSQQVDYASVALVVYALDSSCTIAQIEATDTQCTKANRSIRDMPGNLGGLTAEVT